MDDRKTVELFLSRDERAIRETEEKYGAYCRYIAGGILPSHEDCEECVADAITAVWNSIPPEEPESLKAYIGRITRNLALNRLKALNAGKRGGGVLTEALNELTECASDSSVERELDMKEMKKCIDSFIGGLSRKQREVFVRRYWYLRTSVQIAEDLGMTEGSVNVMLHRLRCELRKHLEREGYGS